jgi:hypothetical protein
MGTISHPPASNFVDDPHAPEIYASNFSGIQVLMGNVMITLESTHADHSGAPGTVTRVVVGRIVLPVAIAESLAMQLHNLLAQGATGVGNRTVDVTTRQ